MLADDVAAAKTLKLALGDDAHDLLCSKIAAAQRFSLSENFASAADQIATGNMAAFANAVGACRAPAPMCWIEVPNAFRKSFINGDRVDESFYAGDIERVGVLIENHSPDGTSYTMHLAYKSPSFGVSICALSAFVDLSSTYNQAKQLRSERGDKMDMVALSKKYSGENLDAAVKMEGMTCMIGNAFTDHMFRRLEASLGTGKMDEVGKAEAENWNGEMMFWLSALALLNTRNIGSTTSAPDISALNRARLRRGKVPLLSYGTCDIDRARFSGRSAESCDRTAGRSSRAHFVRGHFKMRKTGVFWWRPAVRGMAALGVKMKTYRVKHSAQAHA